MKEMLEVLRVQRHDFMNHLQIISGMIQLNKSDQVFGYIRELAMKMSEAGKITALTLPEAAVALLVSRHQAVKQGVEVHINAATNLAGSKLAGPALAEIIDGLITFAVREAGGENCMPGEVFVDIREEGAGFILAVSFVCGREKLAGPPEALANLCQKHGAGLQCAWAAEDKMQLRVELLKA